MSCALHFAYNNTKKRSNKFLNYKLPKLPSDFLVITGFFSFIKYSGKYLHVLQLVIEMSDLHIFFKICANDLD